MHVSLVPIHFRIIGFVGKMENLILTWKKEGKIYDYQYKVRLMRILLDQNISQIVKDLKAILFQMDMDQLFTWK